MVTPQQQLWQFSLRTVSIAVSSVSIGLVVTHRSHWMDGVYAVVAIYVIIGLIQQIIDLLRFSASQSERLHTNGGAVGIAVMWRALLVVFIEFAFFGKLIGMPTYEGLAAIGSLDGPAFYFFILIGIHTKPFVATQKIRRITSRVLQLVIVLLAGILLALAWMDSGRLTFLMHRGIDKVTDFRPIRGLEHAFPRASATEIPQQQRTLLLVSVFGLLCLLTALKLTSIIAHGINKRLS